MAACGENGKKGKNLVSSDEKNEKIVNLFGPMEKSDPNAKNVARSAFDLTVIQAEEELGVSVEYRTCLLYTSPSPRDA